MNAIYNNYNDCVVTTDAHENLRQHVQQRLQSEIEALERQIHVLHAHPAEHRHRMIATYERLLVQKQDFLSRCRSGKSFRTPVQWVRPVG